MEEPQTGKYEPFHLKYRPRLFGQLLGQNAIAKTLSNAVASHGREGTKRLRQAYLFCGSRGTGKTSSARILAKSVNCTAQSIPTATPCDSCLSCRMVRDGSHPDLIEIDAASQSGVDKMRELIERVSYTPIAGRYKVYVIDEAHGLSKSAQDALLKTLEEPPPHVVFVLCTTEPERLLPTITSRCLRFDFKRIDEQAMIAHLNNVAYAEGISISSDALVLVAQLANGGMRDALTLLDQLSLLAMGKETLVQPEDVWDLVGAVSFDDLLDVSLAIVESNASVVQERIQALLQRGKEPVVLLESLASFWRHLAIIKTAPTTPQPPSVSPTAWNGMIGLVTRFDLNVILQGLEYLKSSFSTIRETTQPLLWIEIIAISMMRSLTPVSHIPDESSFSQPIDTHPVSACEGNPLSTQSNSTKQTTSISPEPSVSSSESVVPSQSQRFDGASRSPSQADLSQLIDAELRRINQTFARNFKKFGSLLAVMHPNVILIDFTGAMSLFDAKALDAVCQRLTTRFGIAYSWKRNTAPITTATITKIATDASVSYEPMSVEPARLPSLNHTDPEDVKEALSIIESFWNGSSLSLSTLASFPSKPYDPNIPF